MMNLQDGLARIAGPGTEPTAEQVAADLARGQKALRRRRTAQVAGGSVFAVAALAAALVAGTGTAAPQQQQPQAAATTPQTAVTRLVAYQGEQPKGFELDKVPEGWVLQGSDDNGLVIAPKGTKDTNPNSFEGKIVAMLQSSWPKDELKGKDVTVNGKPAVLTKMLDQTTGHALFVELGPERYLVVQVWDDLGWGEKEVLEFASGIHVNDSAKTTAG